MSKSFKQKRYKDSESRCRKNNPYTRHRLTLDIAEDCAIIGGPQFRSSTIRELENESNALQEIERESSRTYESNE